MQEVTIFRHAAHEGPGYFAEFLDRKGIDYRLVRVDCDDPVPQSLDGIAGLVLMGGPMSVNDPLPWIPKVTHLIQQAIAGDAYGVPLARRNLRHSRGRHPRAGIH